MPTPSSSASTVNATDSNPILSFIPPAQILENTPVGPLAAPIRLRADHLLPDTPAMGSTGATPSLSWVNPTAPEGWAQTAVELEFARGPIGATPETKTVTLSGQEAVSSAFIPWPLAPLASRERITWRVRVAGADGAWSSWSKTASVETGLLSSADWSATPIAPADTQVRTDPAPVMVRSFTVPADVTAVRLHLTAAGIYEAYLDGVKVGTDELAPGWTEYKDRYLVSTHDLTAALTPGEHELAVILGNGWHRGQLSWTCETEVYGDSLWLLAQLEVTSAAAGTEIIPTDAQWTWRPSNVIANDLYDGEHIDLRLPTLGSPSEQAPVRVQELPAAALVPATLPLPTVIGEVMPVEVITTPSGKKILDLGQNITGHVRISIPGGAAGDVVTIRHAEVLEHGELGMRPLRNAQATDVITLAGNGTPEAPEVVAPTLTQHGFRYVEVSGFPGDDQALAQSVVGRVVSAGMERTGWFSCSEPLVTRLVENTRWSTVDNFITIPTDCPQRDERLGWTGDIGAFAPTALDLYDASAFLNSWCVDVNGSQGDNGGIPVVVPDVLDGPRLTCAWGDAVVLVPWAVWEATGDPRVLADSVEHMARFVEGVDSVAGENHLWTGGFQFGDWLDPDAPPEDPAAAKADPDVVATAYFARSAQIVADSYAVLGQAEKAEQFAQLAATVRQAYLDAYVTEDGLVISDCATVYSQALAWDLLDTERRRVGAGNRLADLVRLRGFRISTGFVGTPLVPVALAKAGHADVASRLILEKGCPSWLYPVTMGATTIWERWDSMLEDGSINPGQMTSFNHYALGAVTHWLMSDLAGLSCAAPGWRELTVAPQVGAGFTNASATQMTPLGLAASAWELAGRKLSLTVTVPVGSTATIVLPDGTSERVGHGVHERRCTLPEEMVTVTAPQTVREVIDHPRWPEVLDSAVAGGHPMYVHGGLGVLLNFLKHELDSPAVTLPSAATMHGFIPGLESTKANLEATITSIVNE